MAELKYQDRDFVVSLITEGTKLVRVILNDGGLEFPFAQGGYDKLADFLVSEYGGTKAEAIQALNDCQPLTGLEVAGAPAAMAPEKGKKGGSGRKQKEPKAPKEEKAPKEPKAPKEEKETVTQSFTLADGEVKEKKIQVKTILPDQKPESVEDVALDEVYGLHIDIYSKKNRTSALYIIADGKTVADYPDSVEVMVISGVSLMDVIYAFAEKKILSFSQADKYIKIKRGLIPEPTPKAPKVKETPLVPAVETPVPTVETSSHQDMQDTDPVGDPSHNGTIGTKGEPGIPVTKAGKNNKGAKAPKGPLGGADPTTEIEESNADDQQDKESGINDESDDGQGTSPGAPNDNEDELDPVED